MLGIGRRVVAGEDVWEGHRDVLVGWVVFELHRIQAVQTASGAAGGGWEDRAFYLTFRTQSAVMSGYGCCGAVGGGSDVDASAVGCGVRLRVPV